MTLDELVERKSHEGFTLVEILLAIGILGVVAAITIPALIQHTNRKDWMTALKKSYTILSEGFKQTEALNGKIASWEEEEFYSNFIEGFKVSKSCEGSSCLPNEVYLNESGFTSPENSKSYVLADGQAISLSLTDTNCATAVGSLEGICGNVFIDVNGEKGPNTMGKDFFGFYVTKEGIIPYGSKKIDVIQSGYKWVAKGCNNGNAVCAEGKMFSCSNAQTDQTACKTCGGDWRVYSQAAYSTPVTGYKVATYKPVSYAATYRSHYHAGYTSYSDACQAGRYHAGYTSYSSACQAGRYHAGYYSCQSYGCTSHESSGYRSCTRYGCTSYRYHEAYYQCTSYAVYHAEYYQCTSYAIYHPASTTYSLAGYSVASYGPETYSSYIESYKQHAAVYKETCGGTIPENTCLGYKYTQEWDCWQTDAGAPYDDPCNAHGVASSKSCSFKTTDALGDCRLDDKGTSCGAWAIINDNMMYLDDKEVTW